MPSNPIDEFTASLQPADILTLFAGLRNTVPVYAALGATGLNAGEEEELARRRGPLPPPAPRQRTFEDEQRDFEAQFPDPAVRRAVLAELIAQRTQPYHPATATRRKDFEAAPESARQSVQAVPRKKMATGGAVKALVGSKAKAREVLNKPLFHGGNYKKGTTVTQPLYMTPNQAMAQSYADPMRIQGALLQELKPDVKNPAPERLVRAAARRHVPENEKFYTPASAFDENLHDPADIAKLIDELERRGYDSAVARDIGMGPGVTSGEALVVFPGAKAFNKGGSVKKTLDQMQAELLKKGTKVADKPDLSRRSLFGLGPQSSFPLANVDTKALEKMQQELKGAPSITEKSVTVDPGKGGVSETIKSVAATPMSRRSVLQTAAGQALRGALPDMTGLGALGDVAKTVQAAPKAVPAMPQTLQGLIAHFAKKGLDEDDTIKMLEKLGYDEDDVLYMLNPMRNPDEFVADLGEESMTPSYALSNLINTGINNPPMSMRGPLREIKRENPGMYNDLIRAARDISEYGFED